MWIVKYFDKLKRMDDLISRKATGNSNIFSEKMSLSRRSLMGYLQAMKFLGFPIKYDRHRESYFYKENGKMVNKLFRSLDKSEQKKINKYFSADDKKNCASALLLNNNEKINEHCKDLFIE